MPHQVTDLIDSNEAAFIAATQPRAIRELMARGELEYFTQGSTLFVVRGALTREVMERAKVVERELIAEDARKGRRLPVPEALIDMTDLAMRYGLNRAQLEDKMTAAGIDVQRRGSAKFIRQCDVAAIQAALR